MLTGIETRGDTLWLNPRLPENLLELKLNLRYRGNALRLVIRPERLDIRLVDLPAFPIKLGFGADVFEMRPGDQRRLPIRPPA
jgi:alpha,alpha-trehalase